MTRGRRASARRSSRSRTCALVSGGVESAALLSALSRRGDAVYPVYVRGGHAWERAELHWFRRLLRELECPNLKPLTVLESPARDGYRPSRWSVTGRRVPSARAPDESVYLPGRNILLLAKAAVFCSERGIGRIALGSLGSNPFPDASAEFFRRMAGVLSMGLGTRLSIETPFRRLHKPQVIVRFKDVPWRWTFSCIAPSGLVPCGRCNKCGERRDAFCAAGLNL